MYCHVCEREHDGDHANCITTEISTPASPSTLPFLALTLDLLSVQLHNDLYGKQTIAPYYQPPPIFLPETVSHYDFTPYRFKKTFPEPIVSHSYKSFAYWNQKEPTSREESNPTLLLEGCSDAPECPKTQLESQ